MSNTTAPTSGTEANGLQNERRRKSCRIYRRVVINRAEMRGFKGK